MAHDAHASELNKLGPLPILKAKMNPDYLAGTALGMAPGLIALSALGHQILHVLSNPTPGQLALLVLALALWIAMAIGVQALAERMRRSA